MLFFKWSNEYNVMNVTLYDHSDQTAGSMAVEEYKDIENVSAFIFSIKKVYQVKTCYFCVI
jgi:hypothetical protein